MTLRIETNNFYTEGGGLAPLWLTDEKDKFAPRVNAALEQIRSTEAGSSLLRACLKSRMRGHVIVGVMTISTESTSSMIQI
jgi:hypothetical protein